MIFFTIYFNRINYSPNPQLKYKYPDPTPEIISNMMNSIATVPRLYYQVLHLMNKMNLPPPFGPEESSSVPSIVILNNNHKYEN